MGPRERRTAACFHKAALHTNTCHTQGNSPQNAPDACTAEGMSSCNRRHAHSGKHKHTQVLSILKVFSHAFLTTRRQWSHLASAGGAAIIGRGECGTRLIRLPQVLTGPSAHGAALTWRTHGPPAGNFRTRHRCAWHTTVLYTHETHT